MKSRILPILNAVGCLALTGVILLQWSKERKLETSLDARLIELAAAKDQAAAESQRAGNLERDIAVLKESIEATQTAAESASRALAERDLENQALVGEVTAAREQLITWQAALAERDAKIRELGADLTATRQRLDAAVAKLKVAAER